MMRKFFSFACLGMLLFLGACENKDSVVSLSKEQVYFFYQDTCPHCHVAAQYIKAKHPNLEVKGLDVKMPGNMRLLQQAVKDYKISGSVGTPLICFGKNYIMGWNEKDEATLDEYAKAYEK